MQSVNITTTQVLRDLRSLGLIKRNTSPAACRIADWLRAGIVNTTTNISPCLLTVIRKAEYWELFLLLMSFIGNLLNIKVYLY